MRKNELNEKGDVFIHTQSYNQTIESAKSFRDIMKAPIRSEIQQIMYAHLETIDDQFIPENRDHIFQVFKEKIVDNFNVRMSLDGLSKTAVYYVLMHEIIPELRHQFRDSRDMPYTQNGIQHSYKLAKLLASLWVAIVIPDDKISEAIFHHFNDVYTNKWILDGMDSMLMAYIAFGGGERRIIEFEASQRSSREEDSGKQSEVDSKKTSKQKRQAANRGARIKL